MSRFSTEEWERRKWYLIRSLFSEVPLLSPIPEARELSSEFPSPIKPTTSRAYSPLPDLIIEKEPNRHDESEEYYQALERKIMKFYKKLFRDTKKSSQTLEFVTNDNNFVTLDSESCTETVIFTEEIVESELSKSNDESNNGSHQSVDQDSRDSEYNEEPSTFLSAKTTTKKEEQSHRDNSDQILNETKSTDSLMEDTTSLESQNNETIITKAQVHYTRSEEISDDTHHMSESIMQTSSSEIRNQSKVNSAVMTSSVTDIESSDEHIEHENLDTDIEDSSISNNEHAVPYVSDDSEAMLPHFEIDNRLSLQEPEIMKRRETWNESLESISTMGFARCFSADFSTDKGLEITSVREMEEAQVSSPELSIILGTKSTSQALRNGQELNRQDGDRKRQILPECCSQQNIPSPKQKKYQNLAVQTSFNTSDDQRNWQEIQKHFFEGNPRIFKLCSCNNHICH